MKKIQASLIAAISLLWCTPSQGAEPLLIMPGDYPDPSILRDGDDFYMTHSPFYYAPGFLIWHSRDLVDWEPVCRACPEYEGSAMAPDLVKHNGRYYIYYPAIGVNYVIYADDIRGPWSDPVRLEIGGIDPGHITDSDGNRFLFTNNGWVTPLTDDGLSAAGSSVKVYDGWVYPEEWETEGDDMYLESPKLIFHNGYYYMTSAEGGTAGPATSHMAVMARSKSLNGPWENSPYNPLVHTYSPDEKWWSKGHGTLLNDADGNWWMVYHAYEQNFHTLGRQTLIEPMEYTADGWFRPRASSPLDTMAPHARLDLSDDFTSDRLGLQWTFWKEYSPESLTFNGQSMSMKGKGESPADGRLLLVTPTDRSYSVETVVTPEGAEGGLLLYYNEKAYVGATTNGKSVTLHLPDSSVESHPVEINGNLAIRLSNNEQSLTIAVSNDGKEWATIADGIDVSRLNHNNLFGFFALRPALVSYGNGNARFSGFNYSKTDRKN